MTDLAAALGLAQFERYPALLARRRELLAHYERGFTRALTQALGQQFDLLWTSAPSPCSTTTSSSSSGAPAPSTSSGHLCMVRLLGRSEAFRNRFIERMAARDVACNVHYKPLPLLTAYKNLGFRIADFPNALAQYQCEVTLPLHTLLTDEMVDYVVASAAEAYKECVEEYGMPDVAEGRPSGVENRGTLDATECGPPGVENRGMPDAENGGEAAGV
jgi:dTDP-4-amino-4,6-dideoxygalactose transaminase